MNRLSILVACVALLLVTLACNALSNKPSVSNIRMTSDDSGKTSVSAYSPRDAFFVFADLRGLSAGSVVRAKWIAVSATGFDANTELNTSEYHYEPGVNFLYFRLVTPDGSDWPVGSYHVDISLDGVLIGGQNFSVR